MQVYQHFPGWVSPWRGSDMAEPAGLCVGLRNDAGIFGDVKFGARQR
jgi:hypothetical protein